MGQGRTSEGVKQWDAAKRCYERAASYAAKAGADERGQAADAISRCDREVARIERERRRKAEQARLLQSYGAKLAEANRHERAKEYKEAIAALEAARRLGAGLDDRPASYAAIPGAIAGLKEKLAKSEQGAAPFRGWTSQRKRVKVMTPGGEEWKEIAYYKNPLGMEFVKVPAGEFQMGSHISPEELAKHYSTKAEYFKDEYPLHRVRIAKSFYMQAHEVTQRQWRSVLSLTAKEFRASLIKDYWQWRIAYYRARLEDGESSGKLKATARQRIESFTKSASKPLDNRIHYEMEQKGARFTIRYCEEKLRDRKVSGWAKKFYQSRLDLVQAQSF